jgi:hypothetical protein
LPETAEVLAPTGALDSRGNRVAGETVVATVPCLLRRAGQGVEQEVANRIAPVTAYAVELPFDAPVSPGHRLRIAGRTFEVAATITSAAYATGMTAVCAEVG